MRFFRFDKASLVLKLCLPFFIAELDEGEFLCDELNSFYSSLADAYREHICGRVSGMNGRFVVSVGFAEVKDKYRNKYKKALARGKNVTVIERCVKSDNELGFSKTVHVDVVDLTLGVLIK